MTIKKIVGKMHLWLGLASGLVVFLVAVTGCLYAFKDEIEQATESFRFVEARREPFLPPSVLRDIAQKELADKHLHSIKYHGGAKSAEAIFYQADPEYYYIIYLNPYTGEVLRVKDMEAGFFHFVLHGHFYLWLPADIGQPLVASSTLVFVVMLLTGLILWFPKNRAAARQRFWFAWKKTTRAKRKNYDLHNIPGFYVSTLALTLALTGLVWGFQWFAYLAYTAAGGAHSLVYETPVSKGNQGSQAPSQVIDLVWMKMQQLYPQAVSIEVHPPESDTSAVEANANLQEGTYWKTDYRYFNAWTLEELPVGHIYGRLKDAGFADKMMRMNYDIHTGAIGGLAGKILAFCVSLVVASLPVTGVRIWLGRTKRWKFEGTKD